jgi:uncharacterized RDD family membrane protein YckC
MTNPPSQEAGEPSALYANFPGRLNAMSADLVALVLFSIAVFMLNSALESIAPVRTGLAVVWWLTLLLYEPVFVWLGGGTIGHRLMNLRVVDNRTGGRVSAVKALMRYLVKAFLGVFSFFTMSLSRRHQAIHDLVTNSSVRIRNPSKAQPHQYTVGPA